MPQGADLVSRQANVPNYIPTLPVGLDGVTDYVQVRPQGTKLVTANAATKVDAYNIGALTDKNVRYLWITNLSTTPVKYASNQDWTNGDFHGVIPAGSAQDDGLGGKALFEVAKNGITQISLFCNGAAVRVSVEMYSSSVG